jgi:hypothetical protein
MLNVRWELSGLQKKKPDGKKLASPSLAAEASLFLLYCGNPFYSYPYKPLICFIFGSTYKRSYLHFRAAHSMPLNIVLHLICLVHAVLANSALLCFFDGLVAPLVAPGSEYISLANLVFSGILLLFCATGSPILVRIAAVAVLGAGYGLRQTILDNWQMLLWLEGVMYSINVRLSDAKAVPSMPNTPIPLIMICRYLCQWLISTYCLGLLPTQPVNVVLGIFIVVGSIRPFYHHFNCYWWGYLGWIAALLTNQAWPYLLGAGFTASLHQGVAHELCKEAANLPKLAAMSGNQRAGDEIGHITYFPVLILHSAYQSITGG